VARSPKIEKGSDLVRGGSFCRRALKMRTTRGQVEEFILIPGVRGHNAGKGIGPGLLEFGKGAKSERRYIINGV